MIQPLLTIGLLASSFSTLAQTGAYQERLAVLSAHSISLETRAQNTFINDVFKKNILRTVYSMRGDSREMINSNRTYSSDSFHEEFELKPKATFAFHENILPEYTDNITFTTKAHFSSSDGYLTDGYLYGNGVCHLASLMYWVAKDAGLNTLAPTNHDFAIIPEIDRIYGVAIYYSPTGARGSALQNLYITNNFDETIYFVFDFDGKDLTFSIKK